MERISTTDFPRGFFPCRHHGGSGDCCLGCHADNVALTKSALAKDEDVLEISRRLLAQNKEAYEMLAK
ncbi:MAG: hypothetical protein IKA80_12695 [Spirochaetaceae bacterium]|nr:hypothetical protein [Spirochaetaceae bacterium]